MTTGAESRLEYIYSRENRKVIFCVWLQTWCFLTTYQDLWAPVEEWGDEVGELTRVELAFVAQVAPKEEGEEVGRREHLSYFVARGRWSG